ncbi:MAG: metallophosphoesterase [Candidatus Thiodiazotropha sp. (ex Epidulcina cf. delphinae)]|nr:metallophosphoesterase [Candidatus Thiodiazotropha sp. (ex Epidulcina cf. delphinae)]MCU7928900.1 metallophosphoesterase [Candidatus Thiodiazotropha sp. (ex Dulcina madagascariensis)]
MNKRIDRRSFLKRSSGLLAAASLPLSLIEIAFGKGSTDNFTFAYLSDSHITHIKGNKFVHNWDRGLIRAVAEANLMDPKPDFVFYGGDIAQLGKPEEIDHGLEILSGLTPNVHYVMGEHDYYVDLGEYWKKRLGPDYYGFDHKGVHFIVLNSILTYEAWMHGKWDSGMQRMLQMARLDNPQGSPFMVGDRQREWLKKDLEKVSRETPIVVFSHSPLQKIYKGWNFWTEDAEQIQALLKPFSKVTVIYGHVHQIQYNQIGNISFNSAMATAWPWPYPSTYKQTDSLLPKLTVEMNRADPFFERDATGWQFINIHSGNVELHYLLPNNRNRIVAFDAEAGAPVDAKHQKMAKRTAAQTHY